MPGAQIRSGSGLWCAALSVETVAGAREAQLPNPNRGPVASSNANESERAGLLMVPHDARVDHSSAQGCEPRTAEARCRKVSSSQGPSAARGGAASGVEGPDAQLPVRVGARTTSQRRTKTRSSQRSEGQLGSAYRDPKGRQAARALPAARLCGQKNDTDTRSFHSALNEERSNFNE